MLNSTKTWQEKFDEAFGVYWSNYKNTLYRCNPNDILDRPSIINSEDIKQFISELRKKDGEKLIKMIKEEEQDLTNLTENNDIWKSLGDDARLHNLALGMCERLIKEYYQNN